MTKTIDVLLYVDRLDAYRVDNLDKQIVRAITDSFGKEIWHKAMVVLTHAQLVPPDALSYDEFFSKRSDSLLKCVRQGARISKKEVQVASCFFLLCFILSFLKAMTKSIWILLLMAPLLYWSENVLP